MVAAIGWAMLALPASSQAADFYASDEGSGTADCLTVANACTITAALGKIDDDPNAADVLHLAAGTYDAGSEDRVDVDGPGFDGLLIQGAGRDQTTLKQASSSLAIVPFQFGGDSDNQTIKDLTLQAAATSTAPNTVALPSGTLTLENVDVHGPPAVVSHRVIRAGHTAPDLTLRGVRVFYSPTTEAAASGGVAVAFGSDAAPEEGRLTVEDSSIDVAAGPSRATGIQAGGNADIVVRHTVIRMRRTSGVVEQQGPGISYIGELPPASPSLTISDSAIAGGYRGIDARPHPNAANYVATMKIERTSVDAGDVGVSEDGTVAPYVRDLESYVGASDQMLDLTLRDLVAAGSVSIGHDAGTTLDLTCANNFLGNLAKSLITSSSGSCTNTNTSPLADALPDLTVANAMDAGVAPEVALATAFRPGGLSMLVDTATGTGAPATDLAGSPRLVDAGDADCIAQADRGAYERQGLETPVADCPSPPIGGDPTPDPTPDPTSTPTPGPGTDPGGAPKVTPLALSALALVPFSPRSRGASRAALFFGINRAAVVTVTLARVAKGRRVGGRCRKPSSKNRGRRSCKRLVKVGRKFVVGALAGRNRVTLSRLIGKRGIRPGRYRFKLTSPGAATMTMSVVVRR